MEHTVNFEAKYLMLKRLAHVLDFPDGPAERCPDAALGLLLVTDRGKYIWPSQESFAEIDSYRDERFICWKTAWLRVCRRNRNRDILSETYERLGLGVRWMRDNGVAVAGKPPGEWIPWLLEGA